MIATTLGPSNRSPSSSTISKTPPTTMLLLRHILETTDILMEKRERSKRFAAVVKDPEGHVPINVESEEE